MLGEASSWLGSGVGSSEFEYIGSGVESSERSFSGLGDGASDLDNGSGLESSDLFAGEPGSSIIRLCGRMALGPKNSMPSISDRGVIGFSAGVIVTVVDFLNSTSGSSEESCFCMSNISGATLGSSPGSLAFRLRFLRYILRTKNAPISEAMRTMTMAIPAMAPVPIL